MFADLSTTHIELDGRDAKVVANAAEHTDQGTDEYDPRKQEQLGKFSLKNGFMDSFYTVFVWLLSAKQMAATFKEYDEDESETPTKVYTGLWKGVESWWNGRQPNFNA